MSALPRPDLPPGPHRDLVDALHDLHHHAGWPSLRTLARETGVSHTTVSKHFSSPALPTWGTLELLVEALHGDTTHFHDLWLAASTPTNGTAPAAAPRIAGRRAELAAVRRHLEAGSGLLLVTGEAGIGKTKLVETATATTDALVAIGHCLPLSTEVPLLPVVDALREIHDHDDGQWLKEALADSPHYVHHALARLLPELDEPVDGTVEFSRQHLFTAITTCLGRLAARRRLALLVEDVHWADGATLDLLEYLVVRLVDVPLAATWRTNDAAVSPIHLAWLDRVRRSPSVSVVDLAPLTLEETAEQLRLTTGVDGDRIRRIHARSRGHPLFTAHLALQPEDGSPLSSLLTDLLDRRLDLSGDAARVTTVLAVADRGLDAGLLARVTALDADQVVDALHVLSSRHLLARDSRGDAQLAHPLLAEAARRRLVPGEGPDLHRRLAEALGDLPEAEPAEVAEHWRGADEPTAELPWRVRAAEQANRRTDPASEARQWLRALDIARHHHVAEFDRAAARIAAYDALELSGELDRCLVLAREALDELDGLDDRSAAEVLRRAGHAEMVVAEDVPAAMALIDRAVAILDEQGSSECLVHSLDLRTHGLCMLERNTEALAEQRRALDHCLELGDDGLFFGTSATLAWLLASLGDLPGGLDVIRRARDRVPGSAGPRREAYLAMMHTDMLLQHGRPPEEAEDAIRRADTVCREWQLDFAFLTIARCNVIESCLDAGQVTRAAVHTSELSRTESFDDWPAHWTAARLAVPQGRLDDALEIIDGLARRFGTHTVSLSGAVHVALARLWQGRPAEAWDVLQDAIVAVVDTSAAPDLSLALTTLARCAADLAARPGRPAPTVEELQQLRARAAIDPLGPGGRAPVTRPAATATWDAELARLVGSDTAGMWGRAAAAWDELGRPHDAAYCRWRAARAALRDGQATLATRLLKRAARDAREHVPLSRAIAETAAGRPATG